MANVSPSFNTESFKMPINTGVLTQFAVIPTESQRGYGGYGCKWLHPP